MNEIKVNMENLSESERETLMGLIEKSNGNKKRWKAKHSEVYWYIDTGGTVDYARYDRFWAVDDDRYNFRNMFKTEEETKFELEKRKVKIELQDFADENNNWDADDKVTMVHISCRRELEGDKVAVISDGFMREGATCFSSYYVAQQAIEKVGKERIIKYMFNGGE